MRLTQFALTLVLSGFTATALADTKVAEYGDPVLGNSYGGCTFTRTYSTGGGGYLYEEYTINCTSGGPYTAGVVTNYPQFGATYCDFYVPDDDYYVNGDCENWRLWKKD